MRPYITGKGKSKEERKQGFCVGAKLCSKTAQSEEEARELCARTLPKWVKKAMPKEDEQLSCPERMTRVHQTIDAITLGLKTGDVDEVLPASAQMLNDISKCATGEVIELAGIAANYLKDISKGAYLKGEGKDIQNQLSALKELL